MERKVISNLKYADVTTLLASSEEETIDLFNRVEGISGKLDLKINRDTK